MKAKQFRTDNGVFASKVFKNAVEALNQHVSFCGPYAHHQNGVAERAIRSITEKAQKILLTAMSQWPDVVTVKMWTMALRYAVDIHNATPSENGLSPEDIFTGQKLDSRLQDFHTFGSPVFVLHPILANGKQLPKWKPRSRMGMYLGSSPPSFKDRALSTKSEVRAGFAAVPRCLQQQIYDSGVESQK